MASYLLVNRPGGRPLSECEWWSFSGSDERELRRCLEQLDDFVVKNFIVKNWNGVWASPLILGRIGEGCYYPHLRETISIERAWTAAGASRLVDLLPESLGDLRDELALIFGRVTVE